MYNILEHPRLREEMFAKKKDCYVSRAQEQQVIG